MPGLIQGRSRKVMETRAHALLEEVGPRSASFIDRASSPAASSSASRSRAPWCSNRSSSSPTSPPATSIHAPASRFTSSFFSVNKEWRTTIVARSTWAEAASLCWTTFDAEMVAPSARGFSGAAFDAPASGRCSVTPGFTSDGTGGLVYEDVTERPHCFERVEGPRARRARRCPSSCALRRGWSRRCPRRWHTRCRRSSTPLQSREARRRGSSLGNVPPSWEGG
jgi:hypothetical protein